jgi:hypothetical protein
MFQYMPEIYMFHYMFHPLIGPYSGRRQIILVSFLHPKAPKITFFPRHRGLQEESAERAERLKQIDI